MKSPADVSSPSAVRAPRAIAGIAASILDFLHQKRTLCLGKNTELKKNGYSKSKYNEDVRNLEENFPIKLWKKNWWKTVFVMIWNEK